MARHDRSATPTADNATPYNRPLTNLHWALLGGAAIPMAVFGILGGTGTYANMLRAFHSSGTAVGVIAAGEGATAVLAILTLILTAFSQSTPAPVRAGLWAMPLAASAVGIFTATTWPLAAVQALTPMGMCVSAEGLALMARRTMVYRTGIDPEQQRRIADTTRRLAYLRAVAAEHPDEKTRRKAELEAWRVAEKAGAGDLVLGDELVGIQRDRLTAAADAALSDMFGVSKPAAPVVSIPAPQAPKAPVSPVSKHKQITTVTLSQPVSPAVSAPSQPALPVSQPAAMPSRKLLTTSDVAALKNVSRSTVGTWVNRGKLTPVLKDDKLGNLFEPADVAAL